MIRHLEYRKIGTVLALATVLGCGGGGSGGGSGGGGGTTTTPPTPPAIGNKLVGVDFGPGLANLVGSDGSISQANLRNELAYIAKNFGMVRTFSSTLGMQNAPAIAKGLGLKVAAGCWLDAQQSAAQRQQEIANLIANCKSGNVDVAIVGSETLQRGDFTAAQLVTYISQVKSQVPSTVKVTTADTWNMLVANPSVIAACDEVWANFYPYWEGVAIQQDMSQLQNDYTQLDDIAWPKKIVVSETGWPSTGSPNQAAAPSGPNAAQYFSDFVAWASGQGIEYCYFEMFDEVGKTAEPGGVDSHWGLWDDSFNLKAGYAAGFHATPGAASPPFPYTPIPNVPQAVNDLGRLIAEQQAFVVAPGGDADNPNFSSVDQQAFDGSTRLAQIVKNVQATSTFSAGVSAIAGLDAGTQSTVYAAYQHSVWPTWAMQGSINNQGTTDAGYAVEQEIAGSLAQAVKTATP